MSDWKYELDEVGEDAEPDEADFALEPGAPTMENALFVALGIASTLFVFARIILLAGG